jgi:hypothetical protein
MSRKNMSSVNSMWNIMYSDVDKKEREKRVSFESEKTNTSDICRCNSLETLSCQLHDGCSELKSIYFKLINKYFANYLSFNEKDIINQLGGKYDSISYCLYSTVENITRLKKRKLEMFKEELDKCLVKRLKQEEKDSEIPRVVMMEDYDPDWNIFLAKWDRGVWDLASAKKQQKFIKISLIKGGARELDGSLMYNNLHFMEKLVGLLENAQELVFMDFLLV